MKLDIALKIVSEGDVNKGKNKLVTAAKTLADHVYLYQDWIEHNGSITNTCTYNILKTVCDECNCKRKKV